MIQLRAAIITESISHFEVPLYRLCSRFCDIESVVFHINPTTTRHRYDTEYQQDISWGENMLSGYTSVLCASPQELRREVYLWKPDVMLIYGYSWHGAVQLLLTNKIRGIGQIHRGTLTYLHDPRRGTKSNISRPLRNILLHLFDAHHYGGTYSKKALRQAGVSERALFFVPYSIDTDFFANASDSDEPKFEALKLRSSLKWGRDSKVVLFICHHSWIKGPDIAMQVFSELQTQFPRMKALIVGSGRMTAEMKRIAEHRLADGSYFFAGFCPSKETVRYYLASDVVLFTSRYETWARAVNEAMLCRRICVVNDRIAAAGGLVEDGRNGYVVQGVDVGQYASVLKRHLLLPEQEQRAMGERARLKAYEFSYEKNIHELRESILFAAKGRKRYQ